MNADMLKGCKYPGQARLKEGINLKDLVENLSSEFTLAVPDEDLEPGLDTSVDKVYEYDDFAPHINLDCLDVDDSSKDTPFNILKQKMEPITKDNKVFKCILKHGSGNVLPHKSVVYYHYNSYFELEAVPFDSSYLRTSKPIRSQIGVDGLYPGFEVSLMSMKVGEKSRFIVEPEYAFGSLGAPPRIPPNATILLEIEVIKVVDCGHANEPDDFALDEKDNFSDIYKKSKAFHALGNDCFSENNINEAITNYKKAERILVNCKLNDDEEEDLYKKLLFKIYLNLCVCFNHPKIKSPEKVCISAREALYFCPQLADKSAKLFFNLGKANLTLNDFENANRHLKRSLLIEPQNKATNILLKELEEKKKKRYQEERITYQKALGFTPKEEIKVAKTKSVESEFEDCIRKELMIFAESSSGRMQLPDGLSISEKNTCKRICDELNLNFQDKLICGKHIVTVLK